MLDGPLPSLQDRQVAALEALVSRCDELITQLESIAIMLGGHH